MDSPKKGPQDGHHSRDQTDSSHRNEGFDFKKYKILKLYAVGTKLRSGECVVLKGVNSRHGVGAAQAVKQWLFKELQMVPQVKTRVQSQGNPHRRQEKDSFAYNLFLYICCLLEICGVFYFILLDYPC